MGSIKYFSTGHCAPCKIMFPLLEEVLKSYPKIAMEKIDAESDLESVSKYNIMSVPAIIFFKDGKEVSRIVGYTTKPRLIEKVQAIA